MDFRNFLTQTQIFVEKAKLNRGQLHVILSDESCDLDSVVSTLALGFLRWYNPDPIPLLNVPVLNMQRIDFATKTDVCFLFQKLAICSSQCIFRDDIPESVLEQSRFILVNHHVSGFYDYVEEVHDIHAYQSENARLAANCVINIQPLLATATLIAEGFADAKRNYAKADCPLVLELLHAAILLQNINFVGGRHLTADRDYKMLLFLERSLRIPMAQQRAAIFQNLMQAKFDQRHLTLPQILRRQFKILCTSNGKELFRTAICCFPMAVTRFISFEHADVALGTFAKLHDLNFVMLLGNSMRPGCGSNVKQLALIPFNGFVSALGRHIYEHMIINLNAADKPLLDLSPYKDLHFLQGAYYFVRSWHIKFYDILKLTERILINWAAETN